MLRFALGGFVFAALLSGCSLATSFDELTHGASGTGSSVSGGGAGGDSSVSGGGAGGDPTTSASSGSGGTGIVDCKGNALSGAGFPRTPCLDKFNRSSLNTGSIANWTTQWVAAGTTENLLATFSVKSFQHELTASNKYNGEGDPDAGLIVWKPDSFGASQEAYVDVLFYYWLAETPEISLVLKNQYSSGDQDIAHEESSIQVVFGNPAIGGVGGVGGGGPGGFRPGFYVYSCTTSCTLVGAPLIVTDMPDEFQFGARAYDDGTVEVYVDGALKMVRTVNDFKGVGGHVGIRVAGNYSPWVWEFDDWGAGTIPNRP